MTVRAVIDVDLPGPTIDRHVYGHFAEHLGRCIYGGFFVGVGGPCGLDHRVRSGGKRGRAGTVPD